MFFVLLGVLVPLWLKPVIYYHLDSKSRWVTKGTQTEFMNRVEIGFSHGTSFDAKRNTECAKFCGEMCFATSSVNECGRNDIYRELLFEDLIMI